MPFPLFENFNKRRKQAQTKATKAAKAAGRRAASSQAGRELRRNIAASRSQVERLIDAAAKQLGKVGQLLKMFLRIGSKPEDVLQTLNQAIQASGQTPPAARPSRTPATAPTPPPAQRNRVQPRPQATPPSVTFQPAPRTGPMSNAVQIRIGGRQRTYADDDPTITGEMIDVQSSNVHSIGYDFNFAEPMKGTLKVRFLQGKTGAKTGGPLYHYFDVHPDVFQAFRQAASKGKFVWDRLRIRGTVTGHQYRYNLAGITGGYVPRAAKKYGQNQYFVARRFKGQRNGQIREFESQLPDESRGTYQPNRGEPTRGLPNANRPRRGRR